MIKLDDRDLKILSVLQAEGRITKTELALRVNLSPTPCWERLKKLEDSGIIEGYGARIALATLGPSAIIFMEAELNNHYAKDFDHFENAVQEIPEIVECWAVGGGIDYLLKFLCRDIDSYQRLIDRMLQADLGLKRYMTYVVTKPVKSSIFPPLISLQITEQKNES